MDAELDARDHRGRTALHIAAARGNAALCEELLGRGANKSATDADGRTALHFAAHCGERDVVAAVLGDGEAVAQDREGRTPLHYAVLGRRGARERGVFMLLCRAAGIADRRGRTPVHYAAALGSPALLRLLLRPDPDSDDSGSDREESDEEDDEERVSPSCFAMADAQGRTALHLAAASGAELALEELVRAAPPALLNAADKGGVTALEVAVRAAAERVEHAEECA